MPRSRYGDRDELGLSQVQSLDWLLPVGYCPSALAVGFLLLPSSKGSYLEEDTTGGLRLNLAVSGGCRFSLLPLR